MGELSAPVVVLRVTVRAPDLDAFITRYSRHIAGDRIFIFSKSPQQVGTRVRFNLQLQNGEVLIQGKGTVKRVQLDGGDARHPPGMEVQFTPLDERSSTLVDFMMATRAGLAQNVATAPPLVRAVVPPKPTAASLPPALPSTLLPSTPLPLPPPPRSATPPSPPPSPSPSPALAPPRSATLPRLSALRPKAKPAPVARPPSLSLESIWKSEAGQEATAVSPPPADAAPPVADAPPSADPPSEADTSQPTAVAAPPLADTSQPTDVAAPPVGDAAPAPAPGDTAAAGEAPSGDEAPKSANLPTIIPLLVDPSSNAPPIFAESWGGDAPANPFSDVSDGAIEYFVEWSLEQSIGPRALPQAQFSDIPMALPGTTGSHAAYDPASRRRRLLQFGAVFAAGALAGAVVVALVKRSPAAAPAPVAVAAPPPAETAAAPAPAKPAAGGPTDAELVVITRPSGAAVTIDGEPAGNTPLTTHVSAGQHAVAFTKERYAFATANVDAPGKLTFDLHRPSATLHVSSTPPAADVVIAGEHRGKTPVDIKLPGFESYDVRVLVAGGKPWRKTVYLSHASNRVDAALAVNKPPPPRSGRR